MFFNSGSLGVSVATGVSITLVSLSLLSVFELHAISDNAKNKLNETLAT